MQAGLPLVESFSRGPAQYRVTPGGTSYLELMGGLAEVTGEYLAAQTGATPPAAVGLSVDPAGGGWLQDTRQFGAVHGGICNVLMADGSVHAFRDTNGDGYINPGFPIPAGLTAAELRGIGYRDGVVEFPRRSVFSDVFLSPY